MDGLAGSPSAGPPAAATPCAAEGSRSAPTAAEPAPPIRTSGVPTGTVSPRPTMISTITPSYGLGISESTLSVDTSKSGSSNATVVADLLEPVDPIVPSVTVSPSLGMVTTHSSLIVLALSGISRAGNGRRR